MKQSIFKSVLTLFFIAIPSLSWGDAASLYVEGVKAYENNHYYLALEKWQEAVDAGDVNAMFNLGILYANGQGTEKDAEQAINLYRRAAEAGLAAAQHNLGLAYYQGLGLEKSADRAKIWWERAAQQDHAQAQFNLGAMLWNGDGIEKNESEALKWFRKSSSSGNKQAQGFLDRLFERMSFNILPDSNTTSDNSDKPSGTDSSEKQPLTKKTTESTQPNLFQLGKKAFDKEDYQTALEHWLIASQQGNRGAQYYVAHLYENGLGVTKSPGKAVQWYEKSAKNGQAQAQYQMAQYYLSGEVVDKNDTLALFWMQSAADNNDLRAKDYMEQQR